ncbi:PREDICTED: uncharacterized protein LOC109583785 [Amphimedon queenslandica]|nr:PREDICTED: uncharacterized protein LOC109583785 [Amphimedon queenslandica]|eukprot:XP_019854808.1 PREDICTED: uncharacterized protein LOC109583785 [Amphimedon queenslandica]
MNQYNVSSNSTFINITGLNDSTCYVFSIRAYTDNGYGVWMLLSMETLELPCFQTFTNMYTVTTSIINVGSTNSAASSSIDIVIALSAIVGVLLIILTVSIAINIWLLISHIRTNSKRNPR